MSLIPVQGPVSAAVGIGSYFVTECVHPPADPTHTMTTAPTPDWNPRSDAVQQDQIAAYDHLRDQHGAAYSEMLHWSVLGHADVLRILQDHERFSNVVSRHVAVPNGMDPPEHTAYRALIEPYFTQERVEAFRPVCERITAELLQALQGRREVDWVAAFALPFAVRIQCAFMGWPMDLEAELTEWSARSHAATLAQDRPALDALAAQFEGIVARMLDERRASGAGPQQDVTASLMHATVLGQPLGADAIAGILRNWTVGEIGTISAAVGILAQWLAEHADLQATLRAEPARQPEAIDEILRLHGPLVTNRRVATCPVEVAGRQIPAGGRITLHWTSANRDPRVFEAPGEFRWGRNPQDNLLYGAGIHVCPGAALSRMELGVALRALLAAVASLAPTAQAPEPAHYPAIGFARLPLQLRWA